MENKIIKVNMCSECPFMIENSEIDPICFMNIDLDLNYNQTDYRVHENCPLLISKIIIEYEE